MHELYSLTDPPAYPGLFYTSYWNLPPRGATFVLTDQIDGVTTGYHKWGGEKSKKIVKIAQQ